MELEIMYPLIIILAVIASIIILFVMKGKNTFKKGIVVANTRYVKNTNYYKRIMIKYHIYSIIIKVACVTLILLTAFLSARYYSLASQGEQVKNLDIMLCMDISGSVNNLNKNLIKTMKNTVVSLKKERFGITVFDSTPYPLIPLTTDYQYSLSILEQIEKALKTKYNPFNPNSGSYTRDFLYGGEETGENKRGYSLVGDGLSYCATSFNKNSERTKVIILTTDNEVAGEQIVNIKEAAAYCRQNKIKIYAIGTENILESAKSELVEVAKLTGGKYYDYKDYSTNTITSEINKLNKNVMQKSSEVVTRDYPEKIIPYLLFIMPFLFLLDWRIRI